MTETILLSIGGSPVLRWKTLEVEACVTEAARSFSAGLSLELGGATAMQVFPPAPVTISASGTLLFTGAVDRYCPHLSGKQVSARVSGRSAAADMIDNSADHTKPDYVGKTLLDIARDQDRAGVGFSADFALSKIDRTRPNIGESLFEFLSAHIDSEMSTMFGQGDGSVKFTRAGATAPRQPGALIEGLNFFEGHADHDWSKRHSECHVHGQAYLGSGASAIAIHGAETDPAVTRHRPLHIVHPGHTDADRVRRRARNHLDAASGEGTRLSYVASTWRDSTGALYQPGNKIWVEVPTLSVVQDMLIERVTWRVDDGGAEYADLELVDPKARGGESGGVNKSASLWSTP